MFVMDYCTVAASMFKGGYEAQRDGFARKIGELLPIDVETLEHGGHLAKSEGIKVPGWDGMTDRERGFMGANVLEGYDFAAANADDGDPSASSIAAQGKFEQCMQFRSAKKVAYMAPAASSQSLADPRINNAHFCDQMASLIDNVAVYKVTGWSKADLYEAFPLPESWSQDFAEYVKGVVDEIYDAEDELAYLEAFIASCK